MRIHPKFKFNGESYSDVALKEVARNLTKETGSFAVAIGDFILDWLSLSKTITVSTSGSTGHPKKIGLKKEHMVNSALATGAFFNLQEGDIALFCLPANYIAGKMMLVRAMVLGLELDVMEPSSNPLENSAKVYDFAAMIPFQAQNSISKLSQIKQLIVGGAPIRSDLEEELKAAPNRVFATYGMTETITHIAVRKIGTPNFKTLPEVTVTKDKRDCLIIDAPRITKEKVITNDVVTIISDKEFKWLGRYDSVINSGGIKLIPEQIELKLNTMIKNRFFVAGMPDSTLGEKLVLIVEGAEDSTLLQKIKLIKDLTRFEIPKEIYFLADFTETKNRKLNRLKMVEKLKR